MYVQYEYPYCEKMAITHRFCGPNGEFQCLIRIFVACFTKFPENLVKKCHLGLEYFRSTDRSSFTKLVFARANEKTRSKRRH